MYLYFHQCSRLFSFSLVRSVFLRYAVLVLLRFRKVQTTRIALRSEMTIALHVAEIDTNAIRLSLCYIFVDDADT